MVRTIQEIIQEAFNEVPTITPEKAKEEQDNGALIIDTREINELVITGKVKDSIHIPRGLIEFQNKETRDEETKKKRRRKYSNKKFYMLFLYSRISI